MFPVEQPPRSLQITPTEFGWIQSVLRSHTGIDLRVGKERLVTGRLEKRVRHHALGSLTDYLELLNRDPDELRVALDLLTTNETYFFRESEHLDLLPSLIPSADRPGPVRIWSAASSTGEEAYSIALVLARTLGTRPWQILGTDVSSRVVRVARRGLYPLDEASRIPGPLLRTFCRRGRDRYEGFFTLRPELRSRCEFRQANLTEPLNVPGTFDVVFLRNVMIYFAEDVKRQVLARIAERMTPGAHLLIGRAESITGLGSVFQQISPSVYRLPERDPR